jgi:hypothetical protein
MVIILFTFVRLFFVSQIHGMKNSLSVAPECELSKKCTLEGLMHYKCNEENQEKLFFFIYKFGNFKKNFFFFLL